MTKIQLKKRLLPSQRQFSRNLLAALIFLGIWIFPADSHGQRQVIKQDDIALAGITRPGDLLALIEGWHNYSLDGYRWYAGNDPFSTNQWLLFIDDQLLALDFFNLRHLNALPVSIEQIDSLVVTSGPSAWQGEYSDAGIMRIYTRPIPDGISALVRYSSINETGDPGPYQYTRFRSENVDEIGPDYAIALSYGSEKLRVRSGAAHHFHPATDPVISARRDNYPQRFQRVQMYPLFFQASTDALPGRHHLFLGYAGSIPPDNTEKPGSDLLFFDPLSTEVSFHSGFRNLGLSGNIPVNDRWEMIYRLRQSQTSMEKPSNDIFADIDWQMNIRAAKAAVVFNSELFSGNLGGSVTQHQAESRWLDNSVDITHANFFSRLHRHNGKNQQELFLSLNRIDGQTRLKALLSYRRQFSAGSSLKAQVSLARQAFAADNNIWYWSKRGYSLLDELNLPLSFADDVIARRASRFDLQFQKKIKTNLQGEITASLQQVSDAWFPRQHFQNDPPQPSTPLPIHIDTDISGTNFHLQAGLRHRVSEVFRQRLYYRFRQPLTDGDVFRNVWESFPAHKLLFRMDYTPLAGFGLWGQFTWTSKTKWPYLLQLPQVKTPTTVDGNFQLDLAAHKNFWQQRLRTSLLVKNALNQTIRHHLLGATFDLSIIFKLAIQL